MKKITLFIMLFVASLSFSQTFNGTTGPITDNSCPNLDAYTTTASGVGTLASGTLEISEIVLDISHTWNADLELSLLAPDGTTSLLLFSGVGGSSDNFTGTVISDAGANFSSGTAPYTGNFSAQGGSLGTTFDTIDADGIWTLQVCDGANGDTGTVNSWSITFAAPPSAPNCAENPDPVNMATDVPTGNVTFTWDAPSSGPTPTAYQLYAGETTALEYGLIGTFTTTSAALTINANSLLLYWQIVPLNGGTAADSCPIWEFTTEDPPPPPANDLPGGAITLTLDEGSACGANTIVGISNEGTTDSAGAAVPSCGSYGTPTDRGDLWYVFTAPNSTVTLNTTNLAGFTSIAGTYYTGTPGSLVEAGCTEFGSGWPWELTGLTMGETYYLRVWDFGNDQFGTFDLCGYYVSCTAGEATAEVTNNCATTGDAFGVEVTFSAENDATGVSDGTTTFPISGGVATAGPYPFGAPVTLNVVHSDMACDFELGTYQVDACPPSNDNCDNPIAITLNADETCTVVTAGTTVNATASSQANDVSGTPNNDVWFSFVATSVSHTISLENRTNVGGGTSTSTDMGMGLYELTSDCDNLVLSSTSDPESYTATGLTIGSTYLLRVYGWFNNIQNVTFDVCVQTPPPPPPPPANDACSSATVVDTLPFTSSADASAATNNDGSVTSCAFGMNDGVWYTFTPTASGTLDLSVDVTGWDHEIAVYTGSCGVFTCVASTDSGGTGGTESLSISVTAGTQYWLNIGQFSSTDNSEGAYTFNATSSDGVSLGLDDMEISQFTYYPNPVNNILTLDAQKNIESVVAYNMLGQEVLRLSPNTVNAEVDMSSLLSGAYFVKVSIQGATKTVRIIKQ